MKKLSLLIGIAITVLAGCTSDSVNTPKPRGYYRIKFPARAYQTYQSDCPFTFEYPVYGRMETDRENNARPCWSNLVFPEFNGQIHLTYYGVFSEKNYNEMTESARTLAMKHTIRANSIDQKLISYPERKVYGIYYAIEGNTASSVQFFLTDSSRHYLRGALYFNERPQYDSIQPVVKFLKKDIDRLIETFRWK